MAHETKIENYTKVGHNTNIERYYVQIQMVQKQLYSK